MGTIINATVFAGEDVTLSMQARDRSNAPLSLSGGTISWRVGRGPVTLDSWTPAFTASGTVVSAAAGTFTVPLAFTTTRYLEGDFQHQAWFTNASAQSSVVAQGRLRFKPRIYIAS